MKLLEVASKTVGYTLRHELLAKKNDIARQLMKKLRKYPAVMVYGEPNEGLTDYKNVRLMIAWRHAKSMPVDEMNLFNDIAKVAAVDEVKKLFPEMNLIEVKHSSEHSVKSHNVVTFIFTRQD